MKTNLLIAIGLLIAFAGCAQTGKQDSKTKNAEYRKISAAEAKKMLDENPNATLLDVRTEAEFKEKHIPRALLLPLNEVENKAATVLPDKNALILVYCRSGRRSNTAANLLISMGYTNVYDMEGGIIAWPYETGTD